MKTCTNGLSCPTALQCCVGCYFTEADLSPACCTGDCDQGRTCPQNAPMHTGNGGNIISGGMAMKRKPINKTGRIGLIACCLLWITLIMAYGVMS